ncbi:MAG: hypothetical protein JWP97_2102 [Labilithrix sp.]|nr:hypothetical protein [Labilithrix sp.]
MSLDLRRARVSFRERSFLDVLDLALRFTVVHGRLYGLVALAVVLPAVVLTSAAGLLGGWALAWPLAIVLGFAVQVPFTVLASRLVFEDDASARAVLALAARALPRILGMRLLWLVGVTIGGIVLIVPGAGLALFASFVSEVMLLERAPMLRAVRRSSDVVSASIAEALLGLLAAVVLPAGAVMLADIAGREVLGDLFQLKPPASLLDEGGSVLAMIGWFAIIPYATTARFFVYLNVRTSAEGWDVQTRFAALAARAELAEAR